MDEWSRGRLPPGRLRAVTAGAHRGADTSNPESLVREDRDARGARDRPRAGARRPLAGTHGCDARRDSRGSCTAASPAAAAGCRARVRRLRKEPSNSKAHERRRAGRRSRGHHHATVVCDAGDDAVADPLSCPALDDTAGREPAIRSDGWLAVALQRDHRYLALLYPPLVRAEEGHGGAVDPQEPPALGSLAHLRVSRELLTVGFNGHGRVSHEVAVPVGMRRRATLRGHDDVAVAVAREVERRDTLAACSRPLRREQEQRIRLTGCASPILAKLLDHRTVALCPV